MKEFISNIHQLLARIHLTYKISDKICLYKVALINVYNIHN